MQVQGSIEQLHGLIRNSRWPQAPPSSTCSGVRICQKACVRSHAQSRGFCARPRAGRFLPRRGSQVRGLVQTPAVHRACSHTSGILRGPGIPARERFRLGTVVCFRRKRPEYSAALVWLAAISGLICMARAQKCCCSHITSRNLASWQGGMTKLHFDSRDPCCR